MTANDSAARGPARANRLYALLSRISRAIVRTDDPHELYEAACRIAVGDGVYVLAWIGLCEPGGAAPQPVARAGLPDSSEDVEASVRALAARAIDTGRHALASDIGAMGRVSLAAFPLRVNGPVTGAIVVGAAAPFDDTEIQLLEEVAADLSFALEAMRREELRIAAESRVVFLAYYDSQTGLPGRTMFERRLAEACRRPGAEPLAVLAVNLRRYHGFLQSLGSAAGVDIARAVAGKLETLLPTASVARLSDTEFGLALAAPDPAAVEDAAARVRNVLSDGIVAAGQEVFVDAFIGIALHPRDGSPAEVLRRALAAADHSRHEPSCGWRFFTADLDHGSRRRLDLDAALRRALAREEFELHYQPQLNLASGRVVGAEALLRWRRPGHGLISPGEFAPLLEENGLIGPVGEWVLHEACRTVRRWQDDGLPSFRIAVNLSPRQFLGGDVRSQVHRALDEAGLDPEWLELELTESTVLENAEVSIHALRDLKADGVSHALDDFGTGYSSLSYLQRLPVDRIKIDQSFVHGITREPGSAAIARAMVGMAHSLGLTVIAEGVETEGQLGFLRSLACDEMQGYLFSRPLPADRFAELLRTGRAIAPAERPTMERRVLLLVDDEAAILSALGRALRREDVEVLSASTPHAAFDMLAAHPVGVVICEQRLPEMSGDEFLRRVKALHPDTMRIMLTGYAALQSAIDATNRGNAFRFLTKPWDDTALRDGVREAFRYHELERENRRLRELVGRAAADAVPRPTPH